MKELSKLVLAVFCGAVMSAPVLAQEYNESLFQRDRNFSVNERPKPGYDAEGIRSGAFVVFPELRGEIIASDNIFATETDEDSDVIFVFTPSVNIRSDFGRHALRGYADLQRREYADFGNESVTNYTVGSEGRLDIQRGSYITGGLDYRQLHEGRSSARSVNGSASPIEYGQFIVNANAAHETGRVKFEVGGSLSDFDFDDVALVNGGTADQDFRDSDVVGLSARADYAISPDTAVFGRVRYEDQSHDTLQANGLTRDQNGLTIDAGANFDLTNLMRGEIGVGYLNRSFDEPQFEDVDGISYTANLEWFATPLVTVNAQGGRELRSSGLALSPAFVNTNVGLSADYEYRRNIIVSAGYNYSHENYRGLDRTDNRNTYFIGGTYLMNRTVGLTANLSRQSLDSNGAARQSDFGNTRLMFGVTLRR